MPAGRSGRSRRRHQPRPLRHRLHLRLRHEPPGPPRRWPSFPDQSVGPDPRGLQPKETTTSDPARSRRRRGRPIADGEMGHRQWLNSDCPIAWERGQRSSRSALRYQTKGEAMLRSLKDLEHYTVTAIDGDVGSVVNFLFDDERWVSGVRPYPDLFAPSTTRKSDPVDHHNEAPGDVHLRSASEVRGYHVHGSDAAIGHIEDFIVDDENWADPLPSDRHQELVAGQEGPRCTALGEPSEVAGATGLRRASSRGD